MEIRHCVVGIFVRYPSSVHGTAWAHHFQAMAVAGVRSQDGREPSVLVVKYEEDLKVERDGHCPAPDRGSPHPHVGAVWP